MATVELKVPMQLGGRLFEAGIHEIEIVRDWFVDEMEKVGLLIVKEGEILYAKATKKKPVNSSTTDTTADNSNTDDTTSDEPNA